MHEQSRQSIFVRCNILNSDPGAKTLSFGAKTEPALTVTDA